MESLDCDLRQHLDTDPAARTLPNVKVRRGPTGGCPAPAAASLCATEQGRFPAVAGALLGCVSGGRHNVGQCKHAMACTHSPPVRLPPSPPCAPPPPELHVPDPQGGGPRPRAPSDAPGSQATEPLSRQAGGVRRGRGGASPWSAEDVRASEGAGERPSPRALCPDTMLILLALQAGQGGGLGPGAVLQRAPAPVHTRGGRGWWCPWQARLLALLPCSPPTPASHPFCPSCPSATVSPPPASACPRRSSPCCTARPSS